MAIMNDDDDRDNPRLLAEWLKQHPETARDYMMVPPHKGATSPRDVDLRLRHEYAVKQVSALFAPRHYVKSGGS